MEPVLAIVIGVLYATGFYMLMRRSIVKLVIGIVLLGHGTNLLIFTVGRITRGGSPIIQDDILPTSAANPVPQALVLTAIVIGFGVLAFTLALVREVVRTSGTGDVSDLQLTDRFFTTEDDE